MARTPGVPRNQYQYPPLARPVGHALLTLVPALAGMWIGQHVRGRIGPTRFRRSFFLCLLALGLQLLLRPFI